MLRLELERRLSGWPLWAVSLALGLLLMVVAQIVVPLLPEGGQRFVLRAFELRGLGDFVLLNDLLALYAVPFFTGMVALQDVLLRPRDEGLLEVLLSKPITRRAYWYGGTGAALLPTVVQGLVLAAACSAAVVLDGTGSVGPGMAFVGALVTLAVVVLALVVTNATWLWLRDALTAIVVGFVVWIVPLLGTTVFLYRPDVMAGGARAVLTFPLAVVWMADAARTAPVALAALSVGSWAALVVSRRMFERVELR